MQEMDQILKKHDLTSYYGIISAIQDIKKKNYTVEEFSYLIIKISELLVQLDDIKHVWRANVKRNAHPNFIKALILTKKLSNRQIKILYLEEFVKDLQSTEKNIIIETLGFIKNKISDRDLIDITEIFMDSEFVNLLNNLLLSPNGFDYTNQPKFMKNTVSRIIDSNLTIDIPDKYQNAFIQINPLIYKNIKKLSNEFHFFHDLEDLGI